MSDVSPIQIISFGVTHIAKYVFGAEAAHLNIMGPRTTSCSTVLAPFHLLLTSFIVTMVYNW